MTKQEPKQQIADLDASIMAIEGRLAVLQSERQTVLVSNAAASAKRDLVQHQERRAKLQAFLDERAATLADDPIETLSKIGNAPAETSAR